MRKCVLFATKHLTEEAVYFFTIIYIDDLKMLREIQDHASLY
ncbi:hypothetical protein SEB_00055 [Staphylococcus epidermidis PM221]|nr:hypothetical protein SEB_00055 [Staphylococcus epidermidis PM221]